MKRMTRWLALFIFVGSPLAHAADHADGTTTGAAALTLEPAADINDLFTWMSSNATQVNLAMSVFPNASATSKFSDAVKYVFHTASLSTYLGAEVSRDIICTFTNGAPQLASCWLTDPRDVTTTGVKEYVTGDPSVAGGIASTDGKVKVFAAPRTDPFFFNLAGFKNATSTVALAVKDRTAGGSTYIKGFDTGSCPILSTAARTAVTSELGHDCTGSGTPVDFFKKTAAADNAACTTKPSLVNTQAQNSGFSGNILAIVVQVDKTLLTTGGPVLNVWAATTK
jgi:hypothetical protein